MNDEHRPRHPFGDWVTQPETVAGTEWERNIITEFCPVHLSRRVRNPDIEIVPICIAVAFHHYTHIDGAYIPCQFVKASVLVPSDGHRFETELLDGDVAGGGE